MWLKQLIIFPDDGVAGESKFEDAKMRQWMDLGPAQIAELKYNTAGFILSNSPADTRPSQL